jgi:tRNA A37 N6-isopentenylltransferase MiaA
MLYLRDVWVNWFEGEENSYNVCEFHEWRKEDFIELLDQVPIIKTETIFLSYVENDLNELPEELLNDVQNKSYIRKNNQREQIEYCFILTDGERCIVIDTMGYRTPIRKSRMIPRQEKLVYEMAEELETKKYDLLQKSIESKEYHILSPDPIYMNGLTRRERQLKQLLFMALDQLYATKNVAEVRYWYTEWVPEKYKEIREMGFNDAWEALFDEIKEGWYDKHISICERLIKGQPYFEKIWELENGTHVN